MKRITKFTFANGLTATSDNKNTVVVINKQEPEKVEDLSVDNEEYDKHGHRAVVLAEAHLAREKAQRLKEQMEKLNKKG